MLDGHGDEVPGLETDQLVVLAVETQARVHCFEFAGFDAPEDQGQQGHGRVAGHAGRRDGQPHLAGPAVLHDQREEFRALLVAPVEAYLLHLKERLEIRQALVPGHFEGLSLLEDVLDGYELGLGHPATSFKASSEKR